MHQPEDFRLASYPPPVESQRARAEREWFERQIEAAEAARRMAERRLHDFENGNQRNEWRVTRDSLTSEIARASAEVERVLRAKR